MQLIVQNAALLVATVINGVATLVIAVTTLDAFVRLSRVYIVGRFGRGSFGPVQWRLGHGLALALELLIGSDIIRTAVAPSWVELGQLAAIVALRIAINFALQRDMSEESVDSDAA